MKKFPFLWLFRSIFQQHHLNQQVQNFPLSVLDVSHEHFGLLTFIFSKSWKTMKIPEAWKKNNSVVPLSRRLNGWDKSSNYRPCQSDFRCERNSGMPCMTLL